MKPMQGLSLLEALIALSLAALLVAAVVPAFAAARFRVQMGEVELALGESVLAANRAAVAGGVATVMCPATATATGCGDGPDWSSGWLVFADLDHDRRFGPRDVLVRRQPALPPSLAVNGSRGRYRLVFQPGAGNAGSNASFLVCARSGAQGRRLVLSGYGRFRAAPADPAMLSACRGGRAD